jgi:hypothetical protein
VTRPVSSTTVAHVPTTTVPVTTTIPTPPTT